jgi:hypothetical protein
MTDKYLIGIMYENSSTNRNMYLYHGPLNPLRHIITKASPRTAPNKTCQRKYANIRSLKIKISRNNVVSCIFKLWFRQYSWEEAETYHQLVQGQNKFTTYIIFMNSVSAFPPFQKLTLIWWQYCFKYFLSKSIQAKYYNSTYTRK